MHNPDRSTRDTFIMATEDKNTPRGGAAEEAVHGGKAIISPTQRESTNVTTTDGNNLASKSRRVVILLRGGRIVEPPSITGLDCSVVCERNVSRRCARGIATRLTNSSEAFASNSVACGSFRHVATSTGGRTRYDFDGFGTGEGKCNQHELPGNAVVPSFDKRNEIFCDLCYGPLVVVARSVTGSKAKHLSRKQYEEYVEESNSFDCCDESEDMSTDGSDNGSDLDEFIVPG